MKPGSASLKKAHSTPLLFVQSGYLVRRFRQSLSLPLLRDGGISVPEDQWMNTVNASGKRALASVTVATSNWLPAHTPVVGAYWVCVWTVA